MLNPDIIPELVVSGIFINCLGGSGGSSTSYFFLHSLVLHVLQLVALTTAHVRAS